MLFCSRGQVHVKTRYKMDETVNKFLLVGDHLMPEIYLKEPTATAGLDKTGFTYSSCRSCRSFTKSKERTKKIKETEASRYFYQNDPGTTNFQHDMVYRDVKDLPRRTASGNVLRDKICYIAKNSKYDGYEKVLASMVYIF